jgi:hypothetical protein
MEEMHADRSAVNDKGKYAAESAWPFEPVSRLRL